MEEFLQAYKELEKLCGDMYGEMHGISRYIDDMEETRWSVSKMIPGWDTDIKKLKELRHLRNIMVHETGDVPRYTRSYIEYLRGFRSRIMTGEDPLTLSKRYGERKREARRKSTPRTVTGRRVDAFPEADRSSQPNPFSESLRNQKSLLPVWIAVISVIAVLCLVKFIAGAI